MGIAACRFPGTASTAPRTPRATHAIAGERGGDRSLRVFVHLKCAGHGVSFDCALKGRALAIRIGAVPLDLGAVLGKRTGDLLAAMHARPGSVKIRRRCGSVNTDANGCDQSGNQEDFYHGIEIRLMGNDFSSAARVHSSRGGQEAPLLAHDSH